MKGINDWCVVYRAGKCDHVLIQDVPRLIGTAYKDLAQPYHDKALDVIPMSEARTIQERFIPVDLCFEISVSEPAHSGALSETHP
jgi:hypothetical protein